MAATAAALALTWLSFGPSIGASFVSDDVNAIVDNEWVAPPLDPVGIVTSFSWWGSSRPDSVAYRPGATLTFAIDRVAHGMSPSGFRAVNFVLHALCCGLVFALARSLGLAESGATLAAMLFALLPIHSEAVIWIVGRAELGAAIGFLVAALSCLRFRRTGEAWPCAVAAVSIAAGMTFKENAVTVLAAPGIFFVASRLPTSAHAPALEARDWRRDAIATAALAGGAVAYGLLRWSAAGPPLAPESGSLLDNPLSVVDPLTRLLGAWAAFGRYVALTFWPSSLSVDYSYDALGIGAGFRANLDSLVAAVFVAASVAAVVLMKHHRRTIAAALLLFAASYSIVSNTVFVIGTILGERLFYLPTVGLCVAVAACVEPLLGGLGSRSPRSLGTVAALVVAAAAMIVVGRERAVEWSTPVSLFEAAVAERPRSARARMELGTAYGNAGRIEDANRHFAAALEILPDYASAAYNQGNALARARRYDDAAAAYRRALQADPRFTRAWHNLALTEKLRGNDAAWIEALSAAVETSPRSIALRSELAEALVGAGRYADAAKAYDALISGGETTAVAYFNRGVARHHLSGCAAAVEDYRLATRAPAAPPATFAAAAGCLRELGRSSEAAEIEQAGKVANRDTRR